jgi:hypothetical protein
MHGWYPSYAGPWAEQQRAGFCGMGRLGCRSDPRNSDALTRNIPRFLVSPCVSIS